MGEKAKVAFVFPGQGSQYVGMGKDLFEEFDEARRLFAQAEEVLGFPLSRLCFFGPEADLKLTEFTQPAILTVSIAALQALRSRFSLEPFCVAGHSLGEYSALVSVGALDFSDAVRIVRERGRLMQEAVPQGEGAMAAVLGLEAGELQSVCDEARQEGTVAPANFNGGGQIVIAGARRAVLHAIGLARARGARKAIELPVSAPFHCPMMQRASDGLKKVLADVPVRPFSIGVVANVDAAVNRDRQRVKSLLVEQVVNPVRWEESVKRIEEMGCRRVLEIGPGRVLSGLIKRISPGLEVENVQEPDDVARIAAN